MQNGTLRSPPHREASLLKGWRIGGHHRRPGGLEAVRGQGIWATRAGTGLRHEGEDVQDYCSILSGRWWRPSQVEGVFCENPAQNDGGLLLIN